MTSPIGHTVSHYKILEHLGGGGMGDVYRADDTRLGRTVALKFLPPELTRDPEARKRFTNEARAASALQHKNICVVHDIDATEDGRMFICMEYLPGESLKTKIERGLLSIDQAVGNAIQIAEGLLRAHEAGIVHRDIKPANIMVPDRGDVKIVDFGLAKLAGQTTLTGNGKTLGTVAYMSPEQARGDAVDLRSDIWSLGVTLYEMLGGRRPFESEYDQALVYSILNEEPKSLRDIRPDVPEALEKITRRAMAKRPGDRYQTAAELIADLESYQAGSRLSPRTRHILWKRRTLVYGGMAALAVASAAVGIFYSTGEGAVYHRVVVLPFRNLSRDSTQEYLADGMTEEVIERLQHVASLNVPSFRGTLPFKGSSGGYREIANELRAKALVDASIQSFDNRVRVIARLIDPGTDRALWSETYDGTMDDMLDLQSRIAQALVRAVRVEVTHDEAARLGSVRKVDPRAYELYLRAREVFYTMGTDEQQHRTALNLLKQAIALDSSYSHFYPFAVLMYQYGAFFGYQRQVEVIPEMEKAVEAALLLDADCSSTQLALGILNEARWDWNGADSAFHRALEISPGDAQIHQAYANMLQWRGKFDEAIARLHRANEIDPSIDPHGFWTAATYVNARRYDEAIEMTRGYLKRFPDDPVLSLIMGFALAQSGRCDSATVCLERALKLSVDDRWIEVNCAQMYGICGRETRARELLNYYLSNKKKGFIEPYNVASTYAILRDTVLAYSWLERAYAARSQSLDGLKIDPAWDGQHSNPRYQEMIRKVGLDR